MFTLGWSIASFLIGLIAGFCVALIPTARERERERKSETLEVWDHSGEWRFK